MTVITAVEASANQSSAGGAWRSSQPRDDDHREHRDDDHRRGGQDEHARVGGEREVNDPEDVAQPGGQRDPGRPGPRGDLGHVQALVEPLGRQRRERQGGDQEADRQPAHVRGQPPDLRQEHDQDHEDGEDRPDLDAARETERGAAPEQALPAAGQAIPVEQGEGPEQAEQHQPGLDQHGAGGGHAVRVDRDDPAAHDHGEQAAVADQQPDQDHARRAGQGGQDPAGRHGVGRPDGLGQQRGRHHQQGDPGRLHQEERAVGQVAVDQVDGAAEVRAVVVLGHPQQIAGTGQQQQPERHGQQGADADGHADRGQPALPGLVLACHRVTARFLRAARLRPASPSFRSLLVCSLSPTCLNPTATCVQRRPDDHTAKVMYRTGIVNCAEQCSGQGQDRRSPAGSACAKRPLATATRCYRMNIPANSGCKYSI